MRHKIIYKNAFYSNLLYLRAFYCTVNINVIFLFLSLNQEDNTVAPLKIPFYFMVNDIVQYSLTLISHKKALPPRLCTVRSLISSVDSGFK